MYQVNNIEVREAIRDSGLYGYQIAAALGMSETSFSRAMARGELSQERKEKILEVCRNAKANNEP